MFPVCEDFVVRQSDAEPNLKPTQVDAKWARLRGGGSYTTTWRIVLQGKADAPVVVTGVEIVDFVRVPLPEKPAVISPPQTTCDDGSGGTFVERYFELDLDDSQPRIVPRGAETGVDSEGPEPPAKFPYTVSRLDPELFNLEIFGGEKPCICSWRLAVSWTSGGQSGVHVVERGSEGPIRSATISEDAATYRWDDNGNLEKEKG